MKGKLRKISGEMLGRLLDRGSEGTDVEKEKAAQPLVDVSDDKEEEEDIDYI